MSSFIKYCKPRPGHWHNDDGICTTCCLPSMEKAKKMASKERKKKMSDGEPLVSQFTGDIETVVDKYRDQGLTVAEALGALELVQAKIAKDALESDSED